MCDCAINGISLVCSCGVMFVTIKPWFVLLMRFVKSTSNGKKTTLIVFGDFTYEFKSKTLTAKLKLNIVWFMEQVLFCI